MQEVNIRTVCVLTQAFQECTDAVLHRAHAQAGAVAARSGVPLRGRCVERGTCNRTTIAVSFASKRWKLRRVSTAALTKGS